MSLPQYSVEQLIENIKRRCTVPTSQLTLTEEDFAALATDELQGVVIPLLMSTREEYFVDFIDIPANSSNVITIPDDAVGAKLRSVCYVQQSQPLVLINLPRIDLDIVAGVGFSSMNTVSGFYVQGNELILYPQTSVPQGQIIRLYYYKRALVLADPSNYGQVISIDALNNSLVLSTVPSHWEVGTRLNNVNSKPPFDVTNDTLEILNISAPTVFLNNIEGIQVGDYISELGFSAIPQVPVEAHAYLAQLTAVKCLESLGDTEGMRRAQEKADLLKESLLIMISQRVDGSVKKVMNPNGGLRLRAGLGRWGRGGGGFF